MYPYANRQMEMRPAYCARWDDGVHKMEEEIKSHIWYVDANNLYGWAMSEPLPYGGYKWVKENECTKLSEYDTSRLTKLERERNIPSKVWIWQT